MDGHLSFVHTVWRLRNKIKTPGYVNQQIFLSRSLESWMGVYKPWKKSCIDNIFHDFSNTVTSNNYLAKY